MELDDNDSKRREDQLARARANLQTPDQRAVMHALSARLPAIAWAMFVAGLNKDELGQVDFADAVADLTEDASRLAGSRAGMLMLFGKLAEEGGQLIRELAEATGVDPQELARQRGEEFAQRIERFRGSAAQMGLDWPE